MHGESTVNFTRTSKRVALTVATFGAFMTPFDGSVVTLALPSIGRELGGNVVSLGWVATAYVLGLTICVIPFGRLADIRGRGRVYAVGVALFTLASALCGAGAVSQQSDRDKIRSRCGRGNDGWELHRSSDERLSGK
jgi:MFS family permease